MGRAAVLPRRPARARVVAFWAVMYCCIAPRGQADGCRAAGGPACFAGAPLAPAKHWLAQRMRVRLCRDSTRCPASLPPLPPYATSCKCSPQLARVSAPVVIGSDASGLQRVTYDERGWSTWEYHARNSSSLGDRGPLRVNFIQQGETGAPIVFVHGFGASSFQ